MLDLVEGVLLEFCERSVSHLSWKQRHRDFKMKESFQLARLSGRSTTPREIVDQDGEVFSSVREAARAHALVPNQVKDSAKYGRRARGLVFRYLP